jgi:amino acid transporter
MSFGRLAGSVTAVLYWLSNPIWVGGTLAATTIATLNAFVLNKPLGTTGEIIVGLFIVFLVHHGRPAGSSTATDLRPSINGFLTVIGVLVFLWVGFELSSGASEEMHNPRRDVPRMIVGSGIIGALLYGLTILGIILVISKANLSSVAGFADAYRAVSADLHSRALDVVFLITSGSLSHFFAVMIALVISTTSVSYVFVFPALIVLRRKYPDATRPYIVPGGTAGAWIAVVITELFIIVSAITLLWPGAINALFGQPYSIESSFGVSRVFFESVTLGAFGAMIAIAVLFWLIGSIGRRRGLTGETELVPAGEAS